MYSRRFISILKEKMIKFNEDQKKDVIDVVSANMENSNNILIPLKNNGIKVINTNDILYIYEPKKGKVFINTANEEIEFQCTAYDLLEYVVNRDNYFQFLHNGLVVNTSKMISFNSYYRKVYFVNEKEVIVTGVAMKQIVQKILGKERDSYYDTYIGKFEY